MLLVMIEKHNFIWKYWDCQYICSAVAKGHIFSLRDVPFQQILHVWFKSSSRHRLGSHKLWDPARNQVVRYEVCKKEKHRFHYHDSILCAQVMLVHLGWSWFKWLYFEETDPIKLIFFLNCRRLQKEKNPTDIGKYWLLGMSEIKKKNKKWINCQ